MEYGGVFTTASTTPAFDSIPSAADHIHTAEMMVHPQPTLDFLEELLSEGCWLEATGGMINSQNNNVHSLLSSDHYPNYTAHHLTYMLNPHHQIYQEDHHHNQGLIFQEIRSSDQNFLAEQTGVCRRWWISPRAYPTPCSSVKERLILAIGCLKECTTDIHDDHVRDLHIQICVPVKSKAGAGSGSRRAMINSNSSNNSSSSSDYQFGAQDWQDYFLGLHGRAGHVLMKLRDWTVAEVRFWRRDEYYNSSTRHHHVRGGSPSCLAVPVFERGSGICLGVVEIFMAATTTTARTSINYRPDLEYMSEALESVDLGSFQNYSPPGVKPCTTDELYQAALSEIIEVLTSVCKAHLLPLAVTWAPCAQQGKTICRSSDDNQNYLLCISTIESAYYVADLETLSFLEACNEHHLLPGQGIVGTAFSTNKPCFAVDITAFSKTEYPLSHHARVFGLRAAVAIPLRSVYTGSADFVLEFFLPKDCLENEEQKRMLNSLSIAIQQSCRSLHFVMEKDQLEEEALMPPNGQPSKEETQKLISTNPLYESGLKESSWIAHMMEAQQKGKGISVSLEYQREPREEFKVTTHWDNIQGGSLFPPNGQDFSAFTGQLQQSSGPKVSVEGGGESDSFARRRPSGGRKPGEKRRTKAEKTISLPVLRQYFAGSLKDAAKSIGVCPTTLKRICRQHGINRWPSRKIKKVGHSLRKLQLVIDSVHGTEGAIQIGSFYKSFPELSSPNFGGTEGFSSLTMSDHHQRQQLHHQAESGLFSHGAPSKSPTSSCSQTSGPAGAKQHTTTTTPITVLGRGDLLMAEDPIGVLHRVCSEAEFHALNQDGPNNQRSQSPPFGPGRADASRVKVTLGEEKIRFSLQPNWHFRDLQLEIARRFNLDDISRILVRYVDGDGELVLLTCDTDLEKCKQIYLSSSQSHTIRLSLQWASHQNLGSSFGSSRPS